MTGFDSWNSELMHYGILGQKWGIRRFQNADGTRTPAGQKRRARLEAKAARKAERKEAKRKRDYRKLTDDELKQRINRLELEKRYRELNKSKLTRAFERVEKVMNERSQWNKDKAALIAAKVSRSKTPLRNALQNLGSTPINLAQKIIEKTGNTIIKEAPGAIKKGAKAVWDFDPMTQVRNNPYASNSNSKKESAIPVEFKLLPGPTESKKKKKGSK